MKGRDFLLKNGDLVLPDGILHGGTIAISGNRIVSIGPADDLKQAPEAGSLEVDVRGYWVCPALVELHIHGCGGFSFHNPRDDYLSEIARFLSRKGVGVFLPTVVPQESVLQRLACDIDSLHLGSRVPGIYVEGPFIAGERRGGIPADLIRSVSPDYLEHLCRITGSRIRMVTLAPEMEGAQGLIERVRSRGIIPALGHSSARAEDMADLSGVEPLNVTHLYNAMSGVSHREPGLAQWALLNGSVFTELNGDGVHVHPMALELAFRLRPLERIILISDAVVTAGLEADTEEDHYHGSELAVSRGNGVYYRQSGVLIGSRLLVKDGVSRVVREQGIPVHSAVAMASRVPLKLLGMEGKGALVPGMDADISVFDKGFATCLAQIYEGRVLYSRLRGLIQE